MTSFSFEIIIFSSKCDEVTLLGEKDIVWNKLLCKRKKESRKPYTEQIYLTRGETYYIINSSKGTYSETSAKNYFKIYLSVISLMKDN